jgi:hypothetical protein
MNPAGCTTWDEWGMDAWQTIQCRGKKPTIVVVLVALN